MNLDHTTTLPTLQLIVLSAWAVFATLALIWLLRRCERYHCGVEAVAEQFVAWDEEPEIAEETVRAAG